MNLVKRGLGGAIILAILIMITLMGRASLFIGILLFSIIALHELTKALEKISINLPFELLIFFDICIMIASFINKQDIFITVLVLSFVGLIMYIVFNEEHTLIDGFASFFALIYVPFLMSHILRIKDINFVWILYLTAWGTDTFAYLIGSVFGRRKIEKISHISPNKTLEGSIGGIVGATILNLLYVNIYNLTNTPIQVILFTVLASILSQIGDLVASYLKRQTNIKDFGNLIPGHGGILDRFDSIVFLAPIIYLFSTL